MELNTETKLQLKKLLAKPTLVTQEHIPLLRNLIEHYPYFQTLHLLLAKAGLGTENEQSWLAKAVTYANGSILHQVIHEPNTLTPLENITLIPYDSYSPPADLKIDEKEVAKETPISSGKNIEETEEVSDLATDETEDSSIEKMTSVTEQDQKDEIQLENSDANQKDSERAKVLSAADEDVEPNFSTAETSAIATDNKTIEAPEIEGLPPSANEIISIPKDQSTQTTEVKEEPPKEEVIAKPLEAPEIEGLPPLAWETLPMCEVEPTEATTGQEEIETAVTVEKEIAETLASVSTPNEEKTVSAIEEEVAVNDTQVSQEIEIEEPETPAEKTAFVLPEIENLAPLQSELNKVGLGAIDEQKAESTNIATDPSNVEVNDVNQPEQVEEVVEAIDDESENQLAEKLEEITESVVPEAKEPIIEPTEQTEPIKRSNATLNDKKHDNSDLQEREQEEVVSIESITATDFFAFESNFKSESIADEDKQTAQKTHSASKGTYQQAENIVSKYDDDKMPFTFLWWLSKTRKDHEQIFTPFTTASKQTALTSDLQQQYVENIFHLQSPFEGQIEAENNKTAKSISKGSSLVEKFIKNDPQLKAPKPDQINTENKAKKSAEDNYNVVSETLADIYIEQMLYHKAIDTYQKLSLKFPEKSRYFADLILSLEKKI